MVVKVALLVVFFAIMIGIGMYARKRVQTVGDFVLGGRDVGPWLTAFAYGTSYFSGVVFIGYAGQFGWAYGVSATWIGIGNALIGSLLAWVLLGRRTRIMTRHMKASTMPEFFRKRYDSKAIMVVASLIIFIFLVPYSASVYKGLSQLFAEAFHVNYIYCIWGMAILTAVYVVLGGYVATSINDFVQGLIMLVGIVAVIFAVLNGQGGFTEAIHKLSQIPAESAPTLNGAYASFFGPDPMGLLGVVLLTSLGTWGLPQMVHKFYAIRDERAIKTGTIISTIFALVVAGGSYFMGAFGRLYVDSPESVGGFDGIVPTMLGGQLNDLLLGVVVLLVLSASMSTLSSLVLTSSSTFTLDFVKDRFVKNMSDKGAMRMIRIMCVVFILLSVVLALNPGNLITTLMSLSWGSLAGAFLAPFLYGLFWRRATRAGVWTSFVIGLGITIGSLIFGWMAPPSAGAVAMLVPLAVMPIVSLCTKAPDQKVVDDAFAGYDEVVTVREKFVLISDEEEAAQKK
ncbi:sodium/solute symporter [Eubacteriales bacterium OttesenSCG-928-N13]|nr:sodium/solute symporter [Eubacteriales bacterium OttesenSCG-928-N13]